MNCPRCGASLPDGARFCLSCGLALSGGSGPASAPPPPSGGAPGPSGGPSLAPAGVTALKCPSCGAPITPVFGEMVITCDYCGASVSLGGNGWKEISKHTMLAPTLTNPAAAVKIVHDFLDQGLFHRNAFEESKVLEQKLSFVPFWVVPASASTTFEYQDIAVGVGGTVASIAAAELLGSALSGRRGGGFLAVPIVTGPPVNPTRADSISTTYEYPVVAVKGMSNYQPKNYQFALSDRTFFDKKQVPDGSAILNGDLGEDAARHAAQSYVTQLQAEAAHQKHHMVSKLQTNVEVSEGELLHVPVWYYLLERKGQRTVILIDAHAGRIIQTVGP